MGIVVSVLIGAAVGGMTLVLGRSSRASEGSTLAVGILGALLGTVGKVWLSFPGRFGAPILSFLGAALALVVWTVAQKMLVASAVERD